MTLPDQDASYQYVDGKELLRATLLERAQLLQELETLTKAPQGIGTSEIIHRFDMTRAQTLLFELSIVTERIDSLIILINNYAETCGKPRVETIP
jgi:hypothetical protein